MPPKELKDKPAPAPKQTKPKAKADEKKVAKQAKQLKAAEKGKARFGFAIWPRKGSLFGLHLSEVSDNLVVAAPKVEKPAPAKEVKPAKDQKKRVKKDKDAPKKPMSPFFCYQSTRRPVLKAEQPTLENTKLIKVSSLLLTSPDYV